MKSIMTLFSAIVIVGTCIIWLTEVCPQLLVKFEKNNSLVFVNDSVTLTAVGHGVLPSSLSADSVVFCIYESTDDQMYAVVSGNMYSFPSFYSCWYPETNSTGHIFSSEEINVSGYFPATLHYNAVFINLRNGDILAQAESVIDVLNSQPHDFQAVFVDHNRFHTKNSIVLNSAISLSIGVFLKDLAMHGANMRLVGFACEACFLIKTRQLEGNIYISFLVGTFEGRLMNVINNCHCLIHIVPALILTGSQSTTFPDESLLYLLSAFDAVLTLNTHGDSQTDLLFAHIEQMRLHRQFLSPQTCPLGQACFDRVPRVALDLCNAYDISDRFRARWSSVVVVLIAPSMHMAAQPASVRSGKKVHVVHPSLSRTASESGQSRTERKDFIWPRRVGGRFRVGYFGRLSTERSPGLFVRAVAYLYDTYSAEYLNRHFEFVVGGAGPGLNYTIALTRTLGMLNNIQFWGYVANLVDALCDADVVVNPMARGENFGIMQLESMACGTPVLAFNRSASQESLHPLASHLLQDVTVAGLAEAIITAERDPTAFNWTSANFVTASADMRGRFSPCNHVYRMINALA